MMCPGLHQWIAASRQWLVEGDINASDRVDYFDKGLHVDRNVMIHIHAEVRIKRQSQEARARAWVVPVVEAVTGISVKVCLIQLLMILPAEMGGDIWNLHPKIAREIQHRDARLKEVNAYHPHYIR